MGALSAVSLLGLLDVGEDSNLDIEDTGKHLVQDLVVSDGELNWRLQRNDPDKFDTKLCFYTFSTYLNLKILLISSSQLQ